MVPKKKLSPQEQLAEYNKTALRSNLGLAVFSALYIIGLHIPYFYPGKITSGEITGSISAMDFYLLPLVYQGAMALICSLSILSIALEKNFKRILYPLFFICLPEYSYHLIYTDIALILDSEGMSVLGVGYFVLLIAMFGILISMVIKQINDRYFKPNS